MCRPYPEICLSEHQHRQKNGHANHAVVTAGKLTVQRHNRPTECHHEVYLEIVDQNVSSFFLWICGVFDQLLRAHRTQLQFLIKSHKFSLLFYKV